MIKIEWAKRLDPNLIRRLYASDAKNIQDTELADEVGYGLYARAKSLITVNRVHHESVLNCPSCEKEVSCQAGIFVCNCGWSMTKNDYHFTYKGKQLVAITIVPFAEKFISDWEIARDSYQEKMKAIDFLIHCFHYELEENRKTARPAVVNFLDCSLMHAIELILELAYDNGSKGYNEQLERWLSNAQKSHLRDVVIEKQNKIREKRKDANIIIQ